MFALRTVIWWVGRFFHGVYVFLNRLMVLSAWPFGVHIHSVWIGLLWLLAVYAVVLGVALTSGPRLALAALGVGLWGVLAIGRAWGDNEMKRRRIARKMDVQPLDPDPERPWRALVAAVNRFPDLRWCALVSALMLLWLLPLFFQRIQQQLDCFTVKGDDHFLGWFWFIVDKTYLRSLPAFLDLYDVHITSIDVAAPAGKWCLMVSRSLFYVYVIQGILYLWSIHADSRDAITAVKTDPDMAVGLGRRALGPLLRRLEEPSLDVEEKRQIIVALGRLRCDEARKPLLALIENQAIPLPVRGQAILALGDLGGEKACRFLGELLNRAHRRPDDRVLRKNAAEGLEKIEGADPVPALLQKLRRFRNPQTEADLEPEPDVRDRIVRALGAQLGKSRTSRRGDVTEVVDLVMGRHDPVTRNGLLWAATVQGTREDPWHDLLHDPRLRVMSKTAAALARLGDQRGIVPLIGLLSRHSNPRLLQAGARALGELIANLCHDDTAWRAGNQARIDDAINALVRLVREYGSDETLKAAIAGLQLIDVGRAARRLEEHLLADLKKPAPHATPLVNTSAALRKLVGDSDANRLFGVLEPVYRNFAAGDPSRTALWEALYHLNARRAHDLSAEETNVDAKGD